MKYSYYEESDSLFICLRDGEYDESEEIYDGFVIDFDKSGRPLNIDIARRFEIRRHARLFKHGAGAGRCRTTARADGDSRCRHTASRETL